MVGWLCILFFGLGTLLSLWQLLIPGSLTLDRDGFHQKLLGRKLHCRWHAVSEFDIVRIQRNTFVSFSRLEDEGKLLTGISKAITGNHSGMLGDNFGMKPRKLADLMNALRGRALREYR